MYFVAKMGYKVFATSYFQTILVKKPKKYDKTQKLSDRITFKEKENFGKQNQYLINIFLDIPPFFYKWIYTN